MGMSIYLTMRVHPVLYLILLCCAQNPGSAEHSRDVGLDLKLRGDNATLSRQLASPLATRDIYGLLVDLYIYLPQEDNSDVYYECFHGLTLTNCQHCSGTMLRNSEGGTQHGS